MRRQRVTRTNSLGMPLVLEIALEHKIGEIYFCFCNVTSLHAKTKYGRFLKKLEMRIASKLLRILPEFLQEIIFPDFSLILSNPPEF
jgi:hypothetical protein